MTNDDPPLTEQRVDGCRTECLGSSSDTDALLLEVDDELKQVAKHLLWCGATAHDRTMLTIVPARKARLPMT